MITDLRAMLVPFKKTLTKRTKAGYTNEGGYKVPTDNIDVDFDGVLVPISTNDLDPRREGLAETGNAQLFVDDAEDIDVNDIIIDENGVEFKVMELISYNADLMVKEFIVRRRT